MRKSFALALEPVDYQLTVHYTNYEEAFYKGAFVQHLKIINALGSLKDYSAMSNFVRHYGTEKLQLFLTEVIQLKVA